MAGLPPEVRKERRKSLREDTFNLPNALTMLRVAAIPLCLWFLDQDTPRSGFWASMIFTAAGITDVLDGYLARKLNLVSVFGKLVDPLADKLIVMATLVWMVKMDRIAPWAVVILLARELSVQALRSVAASEGVIISAGQEGKTKTALQVVGIIVLLYGNPAHLSYLGIDLGVVDLARVGRVLIYLSLVWSLSSMAQYIGLFSDTVEKKDEKLRSDESSSSL
ncbi:MAG: CDP-diacylglycerol--glycerol-3-phosphate 3-phosphatidyltransferase [Labilithrix sp.]|nr:CDP-diacylglycerol--glycerol-3-phosphate 3-phosphatidyltransferase [Labilithrix sp.]MCW5816375.1 CDP-diacylglycerol--glycerol-3-phosphate 3-phosphatidyltransferase [Labilithrix sp.]